MTAPVYFNHLSLPAANKNEANQCLLSLLRSYATLHQRGRVNNEWYLQDNIYKYEMAPDYYPSDFVRNLISTERDSIAFFQQLVSRTPYIDYQEEFIKSDIAQINAQIIGTSAQDASILYAAFVSKGLSLSLSTQDTWRTSSLQVKVDKYADDLESLEWSKDFDVTNLWGMDNLGDIDSYLSGLQKELSLENWGLLFSNIQQHPEFTEWLNNKCDDVCIRKIMAKTQFVNDLNFQCGKPHIDSLDCYKFPAKELRMTVHGNSELRIIFSHLENNKYIFLLGGIKTGGNKWYEQVKKQVENRYDEASKN